MARKRTVPHLREYEEPAFRTMQELPGLRKLATRSHCCYRAHLRKRAWESEAY